MPNIEWRKPAQDFKAGLEIALIAGVRRMPSKLTGSGQQLGRQLRDAAHLKSVHLEKANDAAQNTVVSARHDAKQRRHGPEEA